MNSEGGRIAVEIRRPALESALWEKGDKREKLASYANKRQKSYTVVLIPKRFCLALEGGRPDRSELRAGAAGLQQTPVWHQVRWSCCPGLQQQHSSAVLADFPMHRSTSPNKLL
ncbi:hypothetical protein SKAU_G00213180 [Synaphobranchus kaupii]|uniref:Uncharacterized protein n=1 Tax=Synaphobranchus kaupii TaxID=118154 RepID=A0A9Q1F9V1_SYNKA|nr:hypothetical protein SKAU_G00213180 [Synaphobranchus kaupii]